MMWKINEGRGHLRTAQNVETVSGFKLIAFVMLGNYHFLWGGWAVLRSISDLSISIIDRWFFASIASSIAMHVCVVFLLTKSLVVLVTVRSEPPVPLHFSHFFFLSFAISQAHMYRFWWNKRLYPYFNACRFQWYLNLWAIIILSALISTPKSAL